MAFFSHRDMLCYVCKKKEYDPNVCYDTYDEADDTERNFMERISSEYGIKQIGEKTYAH